MPPDPSQYELDPVFLHSKREARFILVTFLLFAFYTVGVSYGLGTADPDEEQTRAILILGVPHWVFWGIVTPWFAANLVTGWFCFFYMKDDPLESSSTPDRIPPETGALASNEHSAKDVDSGEPSGEQDV